MGTRPRPRLAQFLQVNLRYSHFGFTMLQKFLQSNPIDVILIQDPPQVILSGQKFLSGYNFIISDNFDPSDHSCRPPLGNCPPVIASISTASPYPSTSIRSVDLHLTRDN